MSDDLFGLKDFQTKREDDFEEHVVRTILKHYGMPAMERILAAEYQREMGERRLKLSHFHNRFPSFKFYFMTATPSKLNEDCTVRRLMMAFKDTKIHGLWHSRRESVPRGCRRRPFGLIVRWPRTNYSVVLHNGPRPEYSGPRFEFRSAERTFSLEPLRKTLHGIPWEPEESELE